MIPVRQQPEPATFDAHVRSKGLAHLKSKNYALDQPLPENAAIEPYWRGLSGMRPSGKACCENDCLPSANE